MPNLNIQNIRRDFPQLHRVVYNRPLVYLDSGNTSLKPQIVIDAVNQINSLETANIHRGTHYLSEVATKKYEDARLKVKNFINANQLSEVIFTKGTTEAINLVAQTFGRAMIGAGDEIVLTQMEHHSNIVPWQMLAQEKGVVLKVVPVNDDGELDLGAFHQLLSKNTKLVCVTHVSNALGTVNPLSEIIDASHAVGARVLVDGAQAVPHLKVDVQALNCDFYVFSSHKLCGPTGVGVLYGKKEVLERMPPYQGGGDMIAQVTFEQSTYAELPHKFEAGTPNIAGVIGFGAALDYVDALDWEAVEHHENDLLAYGTEQLALVKGLRLIGTAAKKCSVLSFVITGVHPHDIGSIVDRQGVAIRAGHLCAQPIVNRFGVPALARASLAFYNTKEEIDSLVNALNRVVEVMGV